MDERRVEKDVDPRSALFRADEQSLDTAATEWRLAAKTTATVLERVFKARRQFVNGDVEYTNFTTALGTMLAACEMFLRQVLPKEGRDRRTFGMLIGEADRAGMFNDDDRELMEAALHFRNKIAHGDEFVLPPAVAGGLIRNLHLWLAEMVEANC